MRAHEHGTAWAWRRAGGDLQGAYTNPRLPPYHEAEAGVCVGTWRRVGEDLMGPTYINPRLPPYPVVFFLFFQLITYLCGRKPRIKRPGA